MDKLSFSFPSQTIGCILDIKKGRANISLSLNDLTLLSQLHTVLTMSGFDDVQPDGESQTTGGSSNAAGNYIATGSDPATTR